MLYVFINFLTKLYVSTHKLSNIVPNFAVLSHNEILVFVNDIGFHLPQGYYFQNVYHSQEFGFSPYLFYVYSICSLTSPRKRSNRENVTIIQNIFGVSRQLSVLCNCADILCRISYILVSNRWTVRAALIYSRRLPGYGTLTLDISLRRAEAYSPSLFAVQQISSQKHSFLSTIIPKYLQVGFGPASDRSLPYCADTVCDKKTTVIRSISSLEALQSQLFQIFRQKNVDVLSINHLRFCSILIREIFFLYRSDTTNKLYMYVMI